MNILQTNHNGEIVKRILKQKKTTQNELADKLHISRNHLITKLKEVVFKPDFKEKVITILNLSPDIFDQTEDNSNLLSSETVPYGKNILEKKGIPMYNIPASASMLEMYGDQNDVKIVGHLNIPGATKNSFALPVHGHSMSPKLESGDWGVVRPIEDVNDIEWGHIYYIQYGDYRVWKRLIKDEENEDSVILYSDNVTELVNGKPKYASKTIKKDRLTKLCLLTDILKKPNY